MQTCGRYNAAIGAYALQPSRLSQCLGRLIRHQLSLTQSTQACTLCRIIMKTERVLKALLGAKMNPAGMQRDTHTQRHSGRERAWRERHWERHWLKHRRHVASKVLCATLWPFAIKNASCGLHHACHCKC